MSRTTALGLLAAGMVAGAVAVTAAAVVAVQARRPAPFPAVPAGRPAADVFPPAAVIRDDPPPHAPRGRREGRLDYAVRHGFWAVPMTTAKVEALVEQIRRLNDRDVLWVDAAGNTRHFVRRDSFLKDLPRHAPIDPLRMRPTDWPERSFHIYANFLGRPDRDRALLTLTTKLDLAEFEFGPP